MNLLSLALLFLITLPLLTKNFTSDFGTHIAMGRQTVKTWSFPGTEFLNYTSLGAHNNNHEWGFQGFLYLVYAAGGEYAVSFLCWAVVFGIFFFIHRATVMRGAHPLIAVAAIFAFSGFLRIRIQPRPEIFTYLYTAMSIYLLTAYYQGKRKKLIYLFPVLMLVWGNTHGSYLMGLVLCGAFFVDRLARAAWNKEFQWEKLKEWVFPPVAAGIGGLVACGLNPLGYDVLLAPLHMISRGGGQSNVLLSISELTPLKGTGMFVYYKAAVAFAAVSLTLGAIGKRIYLLDLLLFAVAFKGAWDSARAVSMMGLFLAPGSSLHITGFLEATAEWISARNSAKAREAAKGKAKAARKEGAGGKARKNEQQKADETVQPPPSRLRLVFPSIIVASLLVFGGVNLSFSLSQLEYGVGITSHKFSFAAAEFLRKNPIRGNMFNFFDIGGFLDWQLYPQALTFIDGRAINQQVFMEHQIVTGGMTGWRDILRKHGVTYIVTKTMDSSGMILPLIQAVAGDPGWTLVFSDGLFVVFVRNSPENREIVYRYGMPNSRIPLHIAWEAYHYMYLGVSPIVTYQTMANMFEIMGNRAEAIRTLRKALEEFDDPYLRARLVQLEGGPGKR
jgi:hypothetical protein